MSGQETPASRAFSIRQSIEILEREAPGSPRYGPAAALLDSLLIAAGPGTPEATPPGRKRFLTIGMATYDDYDGVYFSAQAIRLYHPEITADSEILVVDNHPEGPCAGALKKLETHIEGYRYLPYGSVRGTAVRDLVFRAAQSDYVLAMDSHVLFAPGALARLVTFLKERPESNDLWQGPALNDGLKNLSTHFDAVWREGMYGVWGQDARAADAAGPPFEIPMQGLGVFACRREAWPGFNPRLSGFGGEEGYLHEKIRRRGGRVFCLPFLRWLHRFGRPLGAPYGPGWRDRIRNYLLAYDELGLDPEPVISHFEQLLGVAEARPLVEAALREIRGPFHRWDAIYSTQAEPGLDFWAAAGLEAKIRFRPAEDTPFCRDIGRALARRAIVAEAQMQRLTNVLIVDDSFTTAPDALERLREGLDHRERARAGGRRLPGAWAFESEDFDRLLAELPATPSATALWLKRRGSLDACCIRLFEEEPRMGAQP